MTTTSRLLSLLSLLQTRRDWPGSVLAERLEISPRTVRRDVDRLREMGYSIHATMGPEGGYRLDAGSELPPLLFDDDQVIALAVSLQAATVTGVGIEEAAMRALTTVRQVMPSRLRHRLDALEFTTMPSRSGDAPSDTVAPEVLIALSTAARAREVLRFDYAPHRDDGSNDSIPPRRVEPHHLVTSHGRWYLVGWDLDRNDWRLFRADRITPRTPTGPRFVPREIPGGDVAEYVSARFKGSPQANQWPCTGKVILHRPADYVRPFADDGIVEDLGQDRCSLQAGSWSWVALAASLNRFDTDIEVLYPQELKNAFGQLAARNSATGRSSSKSRGSHE
ncbi:helix-turn-helix transcriptional regulator [Rhodococcoides kyotonense]|uniref:Predicted DNA-binding transcriptional regulator YafY, contains an HTH and WYL domains n=1 Tax=Rhodococcoides kyotonense TaxID=398843 RepID=A0A239ISE6_9NOCA|nr:WYL domain-containing protein [Rhodococcus kyotonensis]SNS95344.1 Predicted DNA-binding transcriptional regulator YafY, contains an HTH and WYL domains [Rhodococcus kyotonensis]